MNEIEFGNWAQTQWIALVFACAMLTVWSLRWKRNARLRFASREIGSRIFARPIRHDMYRGGSVLVVMLLLIAALVDLRWGMVQQEVPQEGIEVIFLLDVSRSMLAEDVSPNRLARAKQMIKDTVDEMTGDRIGLVIFAGEVRQHIPLTNHYADFKQMLDEVDPEILNRGGSRLGDAITIACNGFLEQSGQQKTIVLLTDGEDQESKPIEAARGANEKHGVRIFAVGLGDIETGARVPSSAPSPGSGNSGKYVTHNGQQVWSRLDGRVLAEVAGATGGAYIPAGTKQANMATIYHQYIANIEKTTFETARINRLQPRFQWFLIPAILLLLMESIWRGTGTDLPRVPT